MKYLLFVISILMVLSSCRKEVNFPNSESEKLVGKWKWYLSTGPSIITPESYGETREREFSIKGIYKYYVDGKKDYRTTFKIVDATGSWSSWNYMIDYKGEKKRHRTPDAFKFNGNDTLILFPTCYDCYIQYFVRIE